MVLITGHWSVGPDHQAAVHLGGEVDVLAWTHPPPPPPALNQAPQTAHFSSLKIQMSTVVGLGEKSFISSTYWQAKDVVFRRKGKAEFLGVMADFLQGDRQIERDIYHF